MSKFDPNAKSWYFCGLIYLDSVPDGWRDVLRRSHCACVCSPVHAPDGEVRKPHIHVLFKWSNSIRYCKFVEFCKNVGISDVIANGYFEPVPHAQGYMRYLLHLDDLDKEQFSGNPYELCECFNGFVLDFTREYSKMEKLQQRKACFALIKEHDMTEYHELLDFLNDSGYIGEFDYACGHTILFNSYLASIRNSCYHEHTTKA